MLRPLITLIARIGADRKGGTAIEYGLIAALIVIAMIASLGEMATTTIGIWDGVADNVSKAH